MKKHSNFANRYARVIMTIWMFMGVAAAAMAQYKMVSDIPYRMTDDAYMQEKCLLDIYYPTEVKDAPVVIWFHSGGLISGYKAIPDELKESGMVVVAVGYRFMNRVPISECIRDAAAAVAWTKQHIARYNGDTHKLILAGHSAGGYLTSMLGLSKQWLAEQAMDADEIAVLAPLSGQAMTHYELRRQQGLGELTPNIDEYAPLRFVRPISAHMLIISADRERELFGRYEEQALLWRMLKLHGNEHVELYELDGFDHGSMCHPGLLILKKYIHQLYGAF